MAVPRDLSCEEIRLSCVCSLQELCNGCQVARPRACEGEACASDQSPSSVADSELSLDSKTVQPSDTVRASSLQPLRWFTGHAPETREISALLWYHKAKARDSQSLWIFLACARQWLSKLGRHLLASNCLNANADWCAVKYGNMSRSVTRKPFLRE